MYTHIKKNKKKKKPSNIVSYFLKSLYVCKMCHIFEDTLIMYN